jgi:tetratricopeptide (TPR) repeat protein
LYALSDYYASNGDLEKAVEAAEEAYRVRSESFGPDDMTTQTVTLHLCQLLAKTGAHERMLEYLEVVLDNMRTHKDGLSDDCYRMLAQGELAKSLLICAGALPVNHTQRKNIYAQAFHYATEYLQTQIDCSVTLWMLSKESVFTDTIPADIDFDFNVLLRLLQQTYDMHLRDGISAKDLLNTLKSLYFILDHIDSKLQLGIMGLSSPMLDWDLITSLLHHRFKAFQRMYAHLDKDQLRQIMATARANGDDEEISRVESSLTWMEVKNFIEVVMEPLSSRLLTYSHRRP